MRSRLQTWHACGLSKMQTGILRYMYQGTRLPMKVLDEEEKAIYESLKIKFESNKICWDVEVPEGWKDIKVEKFE